MFDCFDHYAVGMRLKVRDNWIFGMVKRGYRRLRIGSFRKKEHEKNTSMN